jgi:HrpA-like RNA helicase
MFIRDIQRLTSLKNTSSIRRSQILTLSSTLQDSGFTMPRFKILPLHSGVPAREQREVFLRPPHGARKIVLSTNIAETSVTIDDISFVIDSAKAKEKGYDPHLNTATLSAQWISLASLQQRAGRAGRCKAGVCFSLVSRQRNKSLRAYLESELLRTPLESLCILSKRLNLAQGGYESPTGIPAFLDKAIERPHPLAVKNAVETLVELGAITKEENDLTSLGAALGNLSVDVRMAKSVIFGLLLGVGGSLATLSVIGGR